ncbi:MAG TPA: hypothetical protein IAC46_01040 [Candidatus Onthoplasma faecigallinarum]|nr:hypothetical protein [Candidatus Onthoplasma faecigallinarum]
MNVLLLFMTLVMVLSCMFVMQYVWNDLLYSVSLKTIIRNRMIRLNGLYWRYIKMYIYYKKKKYKVIKRTIKQQEKLGKIILKLQQIDTAMTNYKIILSKTDCD